MTPFEKLLQKTLVTSGLDSAQWNQVQAGLRDRAFFSSRVESARFLASARSQIGELAAGGRSASEIRRDLRKLLDHEGYQASTGDEGTIKDLSSQARLDVLIQTNARQARGYVQQLEGNTPGALAAFPGQELIRTRNSREKRDWRTRWQAAGGKLHGGRMAALKNDPVWLNLSAFGVPWPPFDFGSGMGVRDLSRTTSLTLGLIQPDDPPPQPAELPGFNANLEASVPFAGTDAPEWHWLKESFGDQVIQKQGKIRWVNDVLRQAVEHPPEGHGNVVKLGKATRKLIEKSPPNIATALEGKSLGLQSEWIRHLYDAGHIGEKPDDPRNIKLTPGDFDLVASLWRDPDTVTPGNRPDDTAKLELDTFDGGTLTLILDNIRFGLRPVSFYKRARP